MKKIISLVLKLVVVIFAVVGTILSYIFAGGKTVFLYFTIQSNIAIAAICFIGLILMLLKTKIPNWWYIVKYVGTVAITLTGFVFVFVLAPTMGAGAWGLNNIFTHVIAPIAAIADFIIIGSEATIKKRHVLYTLIPPLYYIIFASIGYVRHWNFGGGSNAPYFFLNWGSPLGAFGFSPSFPFMGCVWWIVALLCLILSFSFVYWFILKKRHRKE